MQPPAAVIGCGTAGASIFYSTDGSEPMQNSQQIASGSSLDTSEIFLLRAKAFATGMDPSAVCSSAFEIGPKIAVGINHERRKTVKQLAKSRTEIEGGIAKPVKLYRFG